MKLFLSCFFLIGLLPVAYGQTSLQKNVDPAKEILVVDAVCGQCRFGLKGKSCDLAVRIKGKAFFVEGTGIDEHGDAHADDGFCNATRKAKVQGTVKDNRFVATYFELLPDSAKAKSKPGR